MHAARTYNSSEFSDTFIKGISIPLYGAAAGDHLGSLERTGKKTPMSLGMLKLSETTS